MHFKYDLFLQPVKELIHLSRKSCPLSPMEFKKPGCVLIKACSEIVHQVLVGDLMKLSPNLLNQ